ncbi:hypothetical protein FDA94_37330 [Herbidospora galbida]|uniref:Uncharacterized protein n=1 Tax=Herbidospora galbida TaxID=2575442 RepID=A0A4U3LS06_9ACTN|nr:hypothetical protein [Herbidospora galbida]TKK78745.1 hypothetical protein FDA94_37330 [Herbidospora galbida]
MKENVAVTLSRLVTTTGLGLIVMSDTVGLSAVAAFAAVPVANPTDATAAARITALMRFNMRVFSFPVCVERDVRVPRFLPF